MQSFLSKQSYYRGGTYKNCMQPMSLQITWKYYLNNRRYCIHNSASLTLSRHVILRKWQRQELVVSHVQDQTFLHRNFVTLHNTKNTSRKRFDRKSDGDVKTVRSVMFTAGIPRRRYSFNYCFRVSLLLFIIHFYIFTILIALSESPHYASLGHLYIILYSVQSKMAIL